VAIDSKIWLSAETGAQIYYNFTGFPEQPYNSAEGILITPSMEGNRITIRARAQRDGGSSETVSFIYDVAVRAAAPIPTSWPLTSQETPATVRLGEKIHLNSSIAGAVIKYSASGFPLSQVVTADGITVTGAPNGTFTIMAQTTAAGMRDSDVVTFTYRIADLETAAPPIAFPVTSPSSIATVSIDSTITLDSYTAGVKILYGLGGSAPTIEYTSDGIKVTGTPGGTFTVTARAEMSGMNPSGMVTFTYRIADLDRVAAPEAFPATSQTNMATVEAGSRIVLNSPTSGAVIRYSTSGLPADSSVFPQDGIEVKGNPGGTFTVTARAEMTDGSMSPSANVSFTYRIADLDKAAAPRAWPETSPDNIATIALGEKITLISTTPDAVISFSTSGTPNTPYPADGIVVSGNPGGSFMVIAQAKKSGMADSDTVTFTYRIAGLDIVAAPTATPRTEDGTPAVLQTGSTVTLQSATDGARIYYSLTGAPVVHKIGGLYSPGAGTLLFEQSIPVSGNAGSFFVIRAIAVKDGLQDSPVATFTYQLPSPVQAVYATPGEGVLIRGTEVTLATTTEGAVIFYEISTTEWGIGNPSPNQSQVYSRPFVIEGETYIRAIAVKDNVVSTMMQFYFRVADQVTVPVPSIPSGSVVAKGAALTLTSATSGASITYTIDGSDPTNETNPNRMFGSNLAINAEEGRSISISAFAHRSGMTPSEVVSISYTVSNSREIISVNPEPNTVVRPRDRIVLSTSITGAEIYYTTDGSEPGRGSMRGSTVIVTGNYGETFVIRAIAASPSTSTVPQTFSYQIIPRTPAPSASIPNGAIVLSGAMVQLVAPEGNIFYTTDGSEPSEFGRMYTGMFELTGSVVLKAIAVADGKAASESMQYIYTMADQVAAPFASIPSGVIEVGSRITLSSTTEGAVIYYTTNGEVPSVNNLRNSFVYEGPITVSRPVTIRMLAVKPGMNASIVNSVTYTVAHPDDEEEEEEIQPHTQRSTDRLFLFDQFADSGDGPRFDNTILRDSLTLAVVSAAEGALPPGVRLVVTRDRSPSDGDRDAVMRALDLKLASLYSFVLEDEYGNKVQPLLSESVEIGIPIPEGYEDTILLICRINEDGTVTAFPTRRAGGMVYAVVDHFSKYAVAVPALPEAASSWVDLWGTRLLIAGAALAGAAVIIALIKKRRSGRSKFE
jgi:transcription elongation GreA/GreB family factor